MCDAVDAMRRLLLVPVPGNPAETTASSPSTTTTNNPFAQRTPPLT